MPWMEDPTPQCRFDHEEHRINNALGQATTSAQELRSGGDPPPNDISSDHTIVIILPYGNTIASVYRDGTVIGTLRPLAVTQQTLEFWLQPRDSYAYTRSVAAITNYLKYEDEFSPDEKIIISHYADDDDIRFNLEFSPSHGGDSSTEKKTSTSSNDHLWLLVLP